MVQLYLYDTITNSSAEKLHNEILEAERNGENEIQININSVGGSIFAGWSVISTITSKQQSGMIINTHISGIAGSMAGVIAMFGNNVSMSDFGLLMVHDPSFGGQKAQTPQEENIIKKMKNSLVTMFSGKRGIDENKIFDLMTAETWFDSNEALENNLVDEIKTTGVSVEMENKTFDYIFEMVNKLENKKSKKMKQICNLLEINETENETVVVEQIENLKQGFETSIEEKDAKISELNNEIVGLNEEKEVTNTTIEGLKKQVAEMIVDNAISEGKIDKDSKENWVEMAVENVEKTVGLINSFKAQPQNIIEQIDTTSNEVENELSFKELRKNDPKKLENMRLNDFENYSKLFEKQYGKKPNK